MADVSISELLSDYMRLRRLNRAGLASELGVSRSMITQWMGGMAPGLDSCMRISSRTGLSLQLVLRAAGHEFPDEVSRLYPDWVTEILDELTPIEMSVVAETARGLLRLRAEREVSGVPSQ